MNYHNDLIRRAVDAGCEVTKTRGGHVLIRTPNGDRIITSGTKPRGRGSANLRARLRRAGVEV